MLFPFPSTGQDSFDAKVAPPAAAGLETQLPEEIDERLAASVQNGNFQVVDFDKGVVDAHAVKDAQQMFGGGDQHALPHQAGGVADARDVLPTGGDGKPLQVSAPEDNPGGGGAGRMRMRTGTPLCSPTPPASTGV